MNRTPETLVEQAQMFLLNLGRAQSLDTIFTIDPLFKKFMTEECGLTEEVIFNVSIAASQAAATLTNKNGIITVENCEKFLAANNSQNPVV
ncbi:MAG TPA: hypothetical protein DDY18_05110 [Flavobacterium sp.]|jgi:KaiC/GvpD/RAD55 family RecA-like ATPase|nr:hypothetical protein [Flavobacterium sp.]